MTCLIFIDTFRVPPQSGFVFYVQCDHTRLPENLAGSWKPLLEAAFSHAFDWLGFGAKTAIGYGAMERNKTRDETDRREQQRRHEEAEKIAAEKAREEILAAMSEAERCAHIIGKEGTPENDVVDIYQRLGDFEPEDQKIIAQALKKYWLAHGKWNVKAKKKKQLEKVNKVKQILGET